MSTSILSSARPCRSGFPLNRCHCPFVKGKWPVMELMIELDFAWNISYSENLLMIWNINLFFIKMENDMHTLLMFQVALYLCFQLKMHLSRTALHQAACWFHSSLPSEGPSAHQHQYPVSILNCNLSSWLGPI